MCEIEQKFGMRKIEIMSERYNECEKMLCVSKMRQKLCDNRKCEAQKFGTRQILCVKNIMRDGSYV